MCIRKHKDGIVSKEELEEHGNKSCYEERKDAAGAGEQNTGEEEKETTKRSCLKNASMNRFVVCGYKNKGKTSVSSRTAWYTRMTRSAMRVWFVKALLSLALSFPLNSSYLQR